MLDLHWTTEATAERLQAIPEDGGGAFLDTVGLAPKGHVDYWVTRDATHDERLLAGDDPAMRGRTPGSGPGQVPVARR